MKIFFKNQKEVINRFPGYIPKSPKEFYFKPFKHVRLGIGYISGHHLLWRIGRLFKTIGVVVFSCGSNKKLINKSWKEFKSGIEKVSLYVRMEVCQNTLQNIHKEKLSPAIKEPVEIREHDFDFKMINDPNELLNFLNLHLSLNHQGSEENLLRILPKIPYDKLENLINSDKSLSGRNLLTFFSLNTKVFPQHLQNKISEKIKNAFDQDVMPKAFSAQEVLGLIYLKLESHPKVLHAITLYCSEMVESTFKTNVTEIPENLLFQCSLILSYVFSHKQISDALEKTLDNSCQNIKPNLLSPKKVLSLLLLHKIGIEVQGLEDLPVDKIREIARNINQDQLGLTRVECLSLLFNIILEGDGLVSKLEAIILESADHDLMHYLKLEQNESFEKACLMVLKGCQNTKNEKVQQGLKTLLAELEERERLNDVRSVWNQLSAEATLEQVAYLLNLPFKGNEKDRICLLTAAIKKDVGGFLKTIPSLEQLKNILKKFLQYSTEEELPELSLFIREMANQHQLLPVLKNYPKLFSLGRLLPELESGELRECIKHFALQPIDDLKPNESVGKFALVDIYFSLYLDFLENRGTASEVEVKMHFFDFCDELAMAYPHQIKQVFHGIMLALEIRSRPMNIRDYKQNREWFNDRMTLIDELCERYPETKESIDQYLLQIAKDFYNVKPSLVHEKILDKELSILRIALVVRKNLLLENKTEWLSMINQEYLPYLFIYLQADQQKAILKLLSEKSHQVIQNTGDLDNEFLSAFHKILSILSVEEMHQLGIDPKILL